MTRRNFRLTMTISVEGGGDEHFRNHTFRHRFRKDRARLPIESPEWINPVKATGLQASDFYLSDHARIYDGLTSLNHLADSY